MKSKGVPREGKKEMAPICIFDTETSGLPRKVGDMRMWDTCRLVEICWILCDPHTREVLKTRRAVVRPEDFEIPESATQIHGISHAHAVEHGEALEDVLREFIEDISGCELLVAHNMNFDENVIRSELLWCRIPGARAIFGRTRKQCTMKRACQVLGHKRWPKLGALYSEVCFKMLEGAHQALNDTRACMEIFFALEEKEKNE